MKITKYKASNGDDYFLEIVNKDDILFGLLRLRVFSENILPTPPNLRSLCSHIDKNLVNSKSDKQIFLDNLAINRASVSERSNKKIKQAIIREIHVYGPALKLGQKGEFGQHTGLGKWLMDEAEKIVKKKKISKISVISGVGVREYYQKLGYELEGTYMVKEIKG